MIDPNGGGLSSDAWVAILSLSLGFISAFVTAAWNLGRLATKVGTLSVSIDALRGELHTVRSTQNHQGERIARVEARIRNGDPPP